MKVEMALLNCGNNNIEMNVSANTSSFQKEPIASAESCTFPIFIPSKSRWMNTKGTAALLTRAAIPFTFVVEPNELEQYENLLQQIAVDSSEATTNASSSSSTAASLNSVVALPLCNQGVSYVRNFILDKLAPRSGWFWMMDDDIQGFFRGVNRVNVPISAKEMFLECTRRMMAHPEGAIFSIDYPFYAWQYNDDAVAINSYNNIAVCTNRDRLPEEIHYRFRVREDYDFTLQAILGGSTTIRFRNLSYKVPRMAVAPGGMTDYYETQKEDIVKQNQEFLDAWPSVSREVIKGTGENMRLDMNVKWILLHPKRCADPVAILKSRIPLNIASDVASVEIVATQRRVKVKKGASKRKRQDDSVSESDSSSEDDGKTIYDGAIMALNKTIRERKPRPPAPPKEKVAPGWKGFTLEKYREMLPETIEEAGLIRIPDAAVKVGQVVLIIPYDLELPCIVPACVVEVTRYPAPKTWQWTAVVEKMRGVPLQTVCGCYRLSNENLSLNEVKDALDLLAAAAQDDVADLMDDDVGAEAPAVDQ